MATFPRTVIPVEATDLFLPTAMKRRSHSGIMEIRATKAVGWSWMETWGLLSINNVDDRALMAFIQRMANRGEIHEVTHPLTPGSGLPPNGRGTANVRVFGASQTGNTLSTDGWPLSASVCVAAGDVIKIAGDSAVYMVAEDTASNGSGVVDIPIVPNLRSSPADNAIVTTTGVTFTCTIFSKSKNNKTRAPLYYAGVSVTFMEALS